MLTVGAAPERRLILRMLLIRLGLEMSWDGNGVSCIDAFTRSCNICILVLMRLTLLLEEQLLLERLKGFPLEQTHDDPKNTLSEGQGMHLSTNGTNPIGHAH